MVPTNPALPGAAGCDRFGAVAQLGERLVRNEEASGSIPLSSTISCPGMGSEPKLSFPASHPGPRHLARAFVPLACPLDMLARLRRAGPHPRDSAVRRARPTNRSLTFRYTPPA